MNVNSVVLCGRITKDLELRKTQNDISVTSFTLAVNRKYAKNNEVTADFISCQAWRKTAELICQYCNKGSLIAVEGRIETGSYDKDGVRHYTTEVICDSVTFLDTKKQEEKPTEKVEELPNGNIDVSLEDLPF